MPSAWFRPGTWPQLDMLTLGDNPGVNGTLPASLPPRLGHL